MEKHLAENMSTAIFAVPKNEWPVRLRARTPPFHGGDTGSNPVRATTLHLNPLTQSGLFFLLDFLLD